MLTCATLMSSGSWKGKDRPGSSRSSDSSSELSEVSGEDIPDQIWKSLNGCLAFRKMQVRNELTCQAGHQLYSIYSKNQVSRPAREPDSDGH
jgi:hypothetical protein